MSEDLEVTMKRDKWLFNNNRPVEKSVLDDLGLTYTRVNYGSSQIWKNHENMFLIDELKTQPLLYKMTFAYKIEEKKPKVNYWSGNPEN